MPRQGNNPVMNENVGVRFSRLERAHLVRSSDPPHTGLGPQFSDRVAMPELRTRWTLPQPVLHQRGPAAPICTVDTRFKNLRAAAVEITSEDLREIESAASKITVQGARYPERLEYSGSLRKRRTGDFTFS